MATSEQRARHHARQDLGQVSPVTAAQAARAVLEPTPGDVKAQGVRLADVFIFGPLMLYAGLGRETPQWLKLGMILLGAGTIIYNLVNFMEISKRQGGLAGMATGPIDRARAEALKRQLEMAGKL